MPDAGRWTLLVYRIPAQPSRLRLTVWRKLLKMGVLYLQDAVCIVPARPDLTENLHYIAQSIEEMGGTCHLFTAAANLIPGGAESITAGFRTLADQRLAEITERLETIQQALASADDNHSLERAEEELKRERVAYLRARKLSYCGANSELESQIDARLEKLKQDLDQHYRGESK